MSVFLVDRVDVKDECYDEFKEWWARVCKYKSEHPEDFIEEKSYKLYRLGFGGILMGGQFVIVGEYETMADLEKLSLRLWGEKGDFWELEDRGLMKLVVPGSFETEVWTDNIVP